MLFFSGCAWISTAILLARSISNIGTLGQFCIGAAAFAIHVVLVLLLANWLPAAIRMHQSVDRNALAKILVLGVMLRVTWALVLHPEPASDGSTYLYLANRLLDGSGLQDGKSLAYWPPGYPFFLVLFLRVFPAAIAVPLSQISLFIVSAIGVHRLALRLGSNRAATVATFLFALWPNLVTLCATPEKEMLVLSCLVWAVNALLSANPWHILLAGVLFAYAALVQPSVQLLIPAALIFLLMRHRKQEWRFFGPLLLGAMLVLTPWAVRNYIVLGEFKLISTNGGDVLYRANNPLATGGYIGRGEVDLSVLPEVERDRVAKALAFSWIKENPKRFAELLIEKQLLFMGDDAYGIYATFRAEGSARNSIAYTALKLGANAWWLIVWLLIAALIIRGESMGVASYLMFGWLYLYGVHTIFESGGKYHVPMLWILCVCLGKLITGRSVLPTFTFAEEKLHFETHAASPLAVSK
jgi:hypothetical protein